MSKRRQTSAEKPTRTHQPTPTFLLELPLQVTAGQAKHLRAHLEAARQFYNAVLSEGQRRLRRMRADLAWHAARTIPRVQKLERQRAFAALRAQYGISLVRAARGGQGLELRLDRGARGGGAGADPATRAYRALNRVCLGQARRVRFRSRSRGISSVENKRADTGLRFVLQPPEEDTQDTCCGRTIGCQP
jgi:hypothetical protein